MTQHLSLVSVLFLALLAGSPAHGQEVTAASLFERGRQLFDQEKFGEAAQAFEAANRLAPHASTLHNAALTWEKANEPARAADDYELALNSNLSGALASRARQRLATLKRLLGYVIAEAPVGATVSVAHVQRASIPTRFHLRPGKYVVLVESPGKPAVGHPFTVSAGETQVLSLETRRVEAPPAAVRANPSTWPKVVGWTGIGLGAASGAAAVGLGLAFRDANQKWAESDQRDAAQRERVVLLQNSTNICWAVAGGAGLAGAAFLLFNWLRPEPSNVALDLGPNHVGVTGTF